MKEVLDFSFVQKEFFPYMTPKRINNGSCFNWTELVYLLSPKKVKLFTDSQKRHVFAKIGNLYYDSESPKGIENWKDLEFYKNYPKYAGSIERQTHREFLSFWKENGVDREMLKEIPSLVKDYQEKEKNKNVKP